jgi:phosphohistidine swiveling domain-containing protein
VPEHGSVPAAGPLVGRTAELGRILAAAQRAADGEGSAVLPVGEPGIGKSRLAAEALRAAAERGFVCVSGVAYPSTESSRMEACSGTSIASSSTANPAGRRPTAGRCPACRRPAGSYTGPVRLIRNESEFGKLRSGDVLVCPVTSPVWSVLFPSMGALVTDTGGLLSHPAIIAREYQVPAVVATGNATTLLRNGQVVTGGRYDGAGGAVTRPRRRPGDRRRL